MDKSIVERILKLNNEFYQSHAQAFSESRKYPWKGFNKLVTLLKNNISDASQKELTVLDVASGNCRLFEYLHSELPIIQYTGVDQCDELIHIANAKYSDQIGFNQIKLDVIMDLEKIDGAYGLVCAFGITHHIPSYELRKSWFKLLAGLVNQKGFLVVSFWNTNKLLHEADSPIEGSALEEDDKFLKWGDSQQYRFVHIYSENELSEIVSLLKSCGLELVEKFDEDFNKNSYNSYLIFKKV